jgi:hypothetical protein
MDTGTIAAVAAVVVSALIGGGTLWIAYRGYSDKATSAKVDTLEHYQQKQIDDLKATVTLLQAQLVECEKSRDEDMKERLKLMQQLYTETQTNRQQQVWDGRERRKSSRQTPPPGQSTALLDKEES